MKRLKNLLAGVLAAIMTLSIGFAAFAEGEGSITVNGTTPGKKYEIYKIFDLTLSDDDAAAYTIDADWESFFFNADGSKTEAGIAYLLDAQPAGGELNQIVHNGTVYYMNITESNIAAFANTAHAYTAVVEPDASKTAEADTTSVTFTGIPLGYYLVLPVDATEPGTGYGSICSLTNASPDGIINMKGEYPTIDKEVDDQDVEVGQTVRWEVTGKVPDTTGYEQFVWKLHDTMSAGLTFGNSIATTNFVVKFDDTVIIDSTHPTASHDSLVFGNNGFVLTMDMTKYQAYVGQQITVSYTAVVNDDAVCNYTHNDAWLEYGHDPDDGLESTPHIDVPVYSSRIIVDKYGDNNEDNKLEGAKFALYKLGENGEKLYYKYTAATTDEGAKVEWIPANADGSVPEGATIVTTDSNGSASFVGLESGIYYLQETEAPEGYNLLTEPVQITVLAPTEDENGNQVGISLTKPINNNSGSILPETGGIGTKLFYVVGAVLLVGSAVMLVVRRRVGYDR